MRRITMPEKEIERTNQIMNAFFENFKIQLSDSLRLAIWLDEKRLNQIIKIECDNHTNNN